MRLSGFRPRRRARSAVTGRSRGAARPSGDRLVGLLHAQSPVSQASTSLVRSPRSGGEDFGRRAHDSPSLASVVTVSRAPRGTRMSS